MSASMYLRISRLHADCKFAQDYAGELLEQCETADSPDEALSSALDDAEQYLGMAVRALDRARKHVAEETGDAQ